LAVVAGVSSLTTAPEYGFGLQAQEFPLFIERNNARLAKTMKGLLNGKDSTPFHRRI
jgi:hypothetical protein